MTNHSFGTTGYNNTSSISFDSFDMSGYEADLLYKYKDPFIIFLMVLYIIVFILGFLGNLFVILVVLRHRHMRTLTNVFFFNLTIGDCMVTCICIPITLGNYVYGDYVYGEALCKVTPFLQSTAVAVSVLSMLAISVNRYFAIHVPLKAKILFSKTRVHIILASIWLVSLSASSPLLVVTVVKTYGLPGFFEARSCQEEWGEEAVKHFYNILLFIILFVIPLFLMSVLYLKIAVVLWSKNRDLFPEAAHRPTASMKSNCSTQRDRLLIQRRRTVRTLVLLVVLFACSWLPYYGVNAYLEVNSDSADAPLVNEFFYPLVQLGALSNSTANPILYCFLSHGFRRALKQMCCCCYKRKSRKTPHGLLMVVLRGSDDSGVGSGETVLT